MRIFLHFLLSSSLLFVFFFCLSLFLKVKTAQFDRCKLLIVWFLTPSNSQKLTALYMCQWGLWGAAIWSPIWILWAPLLPPHFFQKSGYKPAMYYLEAIFVPIPCLVKSEFKVLFNWRNEFNEQPFNLLKGDINIADPAWHLISLPILDWIEKCCSQDVLCYTQCLVYM